MKPTKSLKSRARAQKQAARMTELDTVVRYHLAPGKPDTFYSTSGDSSIERASVPWMPHDYRPTVGFAPNA